MEITIISESPEQTRGIGERIGRLLDRSAVLKLTGDLGCGKTCLVQGLAQGLDVPPEYYVTSPTFTLVNQYPGRLELYHVDLYRLGDAVDFEDVGLPDILGEDGVVAVEWAEKLVEVFDNQIEIRLAAIGEESREIHISTEGIFSELILKNLEKTK